MLRIGETRHPGPRSPPSSLFSIEYINVGKWLSNGDSALESSADFLAIAEHRLIPARARSVANSLKVSSGIVSVLAPACQDSIPGGHAGVGVMSMKGAPITLPTFATPEFSEFFRLGRALRVILPLANGIIAHLFVVYGYQGSVDDPHTLSLTNKLLEAVIGEARVCAVGQSVIIAGDLNAEPSNIPVIAKALYSGQLVDLEAAFAAGKNAPPPPPPASTCRFDLDGAPGTRRDFFLVSPNALSAATGCSVLFDRWFRPSLPLVPPLVLGPGLQCRWELEPVRLLRPPAGWTFMTGPGILFPRPFKMFGGSILTHFNLYLLKPGSNYTRLVWRSLMWMLPGIFGAKQLKMVCFVLIKQLVAPNRKVISPLLAEGELSFVIGYWVVGRLVGFIDLPKLILLIVQIVFLLSTPRFPLLCSFGGD